MSSVTSSFAQISGRVKFFLGVAEDISGYVVAGLNSVSPTNSGTDIISTAVPVHLGGAGLLLKDLGRQIVLYEEPLLGSTLRSPHVATYRQVQVIDATSGAGTEGVDGSAPDGDLSYYNTYYVCVSSANQTDHPVKVVRTG